MQIRLLNETDAETIHREQMTRDFPESELKPFAAVRGLMRRGLYEPLALYENGALAAYAWQTVLPTVKRRCWTTLRYCPNCGATGPVPGH